MKIIYLYTTVLMVLCSVQLTIAQPKSEVLTNKLVIDLCKAGIDPQTIISKIERSPAKFDVSTAGLVNLKSQKVPDEVIRSIVTKSEGTTAVSLVVTTKPESVQEASIPVSPGPELDFINVIHFYNKAASKLTSLERSTVAVKAKVNILKAMVPGTSVPIVFKMSGNKSSVRINTQQPKSFMVNTGTNTPELFGLYRMQVKKDAREATWFNVSAFENKSDKDVIAFNFRKVKDGVYEIVPISLLEPGEYCFVNKNSYTTYGGSKADVFAFGVD